MPNQFLDATEVTIFMCSLRVTVTVPAITMLHRYLEQTGVWQHFIANIEESQRAIESLQ